MEIDDRLAAQIHGIISSDSDSDVDSRRDIDEEYQALKPPPLNYDSIKDKIVVFPKRTVVNVWELRLQNKENMEIGTEEMLNNNEEENIQIHPTKKKRKKKKSNNNNEVKNIQEEFINHDNPTGEEIQSKLNICGPLVDETIAVNTDLPVILPKKKNKKSKKSKQKSSANEDINGTNTDDIISILNEAREYKSEANFDELNKMILDYEQAQQIKGQGANPSNSANEAGFDQNIIVQELDKEIMTIGEHTSNTENNNESNHPPIVKKNKRKRKNKKSKQTTEVQLLERQVGENANNLHRENTNEENLRGLVIPEVDLGDGFNEDSISCSNLNSISTMPLEEPIPLCDADLDDFNSRTTSKDFSPQHETNNACKQNENIGDVLENIFNQDLDKEIEERIKAISAHFENSSEANNSPTVFKTKKKRKKKSKQTIDVQLTEETNEDKLHSQEPQENLEITDRFERDPEGDFNGALTSHSNNSTDISASPMTERITAYIEDLIKSGYTDYFSRADLKSFAFECDPNNAYKLQNIKPSTTKEIQNIILATHITSDERSEPQKLIYCMPLLKQLHERQYLSSINCCIENRTYIIRKTKKMILPSFEIKEAQKSGRWLSEGTLKIKKDMNLLLIMTDKETNENRPKIREINTEGPVDVLNKKNIGVRDWENISIIVNFETTSNNEVVTFNERGYNYNDEVEAFIQGVIYLAQLYRNHLAYMQQIKNFAVCKKQQTFTGLSLKAFVILLLGDVTVTEIPIEMGKKSPTRATPSFSSTNRTFKKEFPSLDEVYGNNSRQNHPPFKPNQNKKNKNRLFKSFWTKDFDKSRNISKIDTSSTGFVKRQIIQNKEEVEVDVKDTAKVVTETKYQCGNGEIETNTSNGCKSTKSQEKSKQLTVEVKKKVSKQQSITSIDTTKDVAIKSEKNKQSKVKPSKIVDDFLPRTQPDVAKQRVENASYGNFIEAGSLPKRGEKDDTNEHLSNSEHCNRLFDVCLTFFEENAAIFEECKRTCNRMQERLAKNQNVGEMLDLFMTVNNSSLNAANSCMKMCNKMKDNTAAGVIKSKKSSHRLGFPNGGVESYTPVGFKDLLTARPSGDSEKDDRKNIKFEDKLIPVTETSNCRTAIGLLQNSRESFLKDDWSAQNHIQPLHKFEKPSSSSRMKPVLSNAWASFPKKNKHSANTNKSLKLSQFDNPIQRLAARKRRVTIEKSKNVDSTPHFLIYAICIFIIEVLFLNYIRTFTLTWNIFFISMTFFIRYIFKGL